MGVKGQIGGERKEWSRSREDRMGVRRQNGGAVRHV